MFKRIKKQNTARPWHLLNPNNFSTDQNLINKRLEICNQCPELIQLTKQCKQCGCFMEAKTKLENATCPLDKWDKESIEIDSTSTIFINIPSYKDFEVWLTIMDFINNAKYPDRIYFGITHQVSDIESEKSFYEQRKKNFKFKNVKIDIIEAGTIIGCQPARKNSHKMYNNEDYYLNMDSHMRSIKDWDINIINDFNNTEKILGKGIYTGYVNSYELHDDMTHTINNYNDIPTFYMSDRNVDTFKKDGIIQMSPTYRSYHRDSYSPYISGHFFFTRSEYVKEVGFVDQIAFTEEEIFMALRYFTAGYNLYIPKNNYVFHHYGRKNRELIWSNFPEKFFKADKESKDFALYIINNNIINNEYGLFTKRTLQDFEKYSGISFKNRDPGEKMLKGLEPTIDSIA